MVFFFKDTGKPRETCRNRCERLI